MQNRLNLEGIFAYLMKIKLDNRDNDKIQPFIARMLDIRERSNDTEFDELHTGVIKMLESSGFTTYNDTNAAPQKYTPFKQWRFNYIVMESLIKSGFMKRELDLYNLSRLYPKLLIYLLQKQECPLQLKLAVCNVSINMNEATDIQIIKSILPHLIDLYRIGNYTLATQAAIALVNLSYNHREHKQILYSSREHIIQRLSCKDNKLLSYSILLLINLSSDPSRKKIISKESKHLIRNIIVGSKILDTSIDVASKAFQLLDLYCKDHVNSDFFSNDEKFIEACAKYIGKDNECELKILILLEKLCERNQSARIFIGRKSIEKYVDMLKKIQNIEIIKKIVEFFKLICGNKDDDNYYILQRKSITKVLDGLLQNPNFNMDQNFIKLVKSLREAFT